MIPHPVIDHRYEKAEDRRGYVKQLFDEGAEYYDPVCEWGFLGTGNLYRKDAQRRHGLKPGMKLLDVASGTGLMAVAAAELMGYEKDITCVEPSDGMINVAKRKLHANFVHSGAESMPLPDENYDFLTVGYAMRHFADLGQTFGEFHRVLKPGGKVLILEVTRPEGKIGSYFFRLYFGKIYPFFSKLLTRSQKAEEMMAYYWETMDTCVRPASILNALKDAGFTNVKRRAIFNVFSEYSAVK